MSPVYKGCAQPLVSALCTPAEHFVLVHSLCSSHHMLKKHLLRVAERTAQQGGQVAEWGQSPGCAPQQRQAQGPRLVVREGFLEGVLFK